MKRIKLLTILALLCATTVRHYAAQAGLTYYSAQKQLDAWTQGDRPKLLKTRMGRQYLYTET